LVFFTRGGSGSSFGTDWRGTAPIRVRVRARVRARVRVRLRAWLAW